MPRNTIDFGIDLGTTTSAIAVMDGIEARVLTDNSGSTFIPSAVYISKKGDIRVGQDAKVRYEIDEENCDIEFKRRMGENVKKRFVNSGREMLPEELSAEVLKELKSHVRSILGENLRHAVVTVPAAFSQANIEATNRAAELAGFVRHPLLQEPVAAALAYGFNDENDRVFWMVYDFGGGTFDAAIMQVRDGVIQVVNHAGDNFLGGRDIDWAIVESKFIPALVSRYRLSGLKRGNREPRWRIPLATLKYHAEKVKIEVSRKGTPVEVNIEDFCEDDNGKTIDFEMTLTPEDLRTIVSPYVTQSINLCRKALSEKGLQGNNLSRILMVGGTTLIPWLREQVEKEIGAPLEFGLDPITVVARGAAIFARTQRIPLETGDIPQGTYSIQLEYEPVGSTIEPMVGGRVTHPAGGDLRGYVIQFSEENSQWRSPRIPLGDGGVFMTQVHAERGYECEYRIELCDPAGTPVPVTPDRFNYTVGLTINEIPCTHSIGVAMANNQVDVFFEKGAPLPLRKKRVHRTAFAIRKNHSDDIFRIPVVEGENSRADRNRLVGKLEMKSSDFRRDLPAGSEVEITLLKDESGIVTAVAYIPVLDEEIEDIFTSETRPVDSKESRKILIHEKKRLQELREQADKTGDLKAMDALRRIDEENLMDDADRLIHATEGDRDSAAECDQKILHLREAIDQVEDSLEWPRLRAEAEEVLKNTTEIVNDHGSSDDRNRLRALENDLRRAIDSGDPDLVRRQMDAVRQYGTSLLLNQPGFWVSMFNHLEGQRGNMQDQAQATQLISQGHRALNNNDLEGLKAVVRQLIALLPSEDQSQVLAGFGGATTL